MDNPQVQRTVTLNQLIRWYKNPASKPPDIAYVAFEQSIPQPTVAKDDYYGPQKLARWEKSRKHLPDNPQYHHRPCQFTFAYIGSPDVFVLTCGLAKRSRLYKQVEVMEPRLMLVPV